MEIHPTNIPTRPKDLFGRMYIAGDTPVYRQAKTGKNKKGGKTKRRK